MVHAGDGFPPNPGQPQRVTGRPGSNRYPQRDSNPCYRRERAGSWAARRWGPVHRWRRNRTSIGAERRRPQTNHGVGHGLVGWGRGRHAGALRGPGLHRPRRRPAGAVGTDGQRRGPRRGGAPADDPDLLGLYDGVPLTERDSGYTFREPDRILIFRAPLLDMCSSEEQLVDEVADHGRARDSPPLRHRRPARCTSWATAEPPHNRFRPGRTCPVWFSPLGQVAQLVRASA